MGTTALNGRQRPRRQDVATNGEKRPATGRRALAIAAGVAVYSLALLAAPMRPTHAAHAMVVSVHAEASRAGVEVLQAGGNAVDAAVAVGFALAVVHPQAGNLGGGGFMLVRTAAGVERFLDYREKAPAASAAAMYQDAQGELIPNASIVGYRAISVPGSVAGLVYAQRHWGRLPLPRVMQPAVRLARGGFPLAYEDAQDLRDPDLSKFSESRRIFQRNGRYYLPGEILRQPELARTLERIARDPEDFYHGAMARELAAAMQKGGGLITTADLASYSVKERPPVHGTYHGYGVISAPPPSSGGIALIETLNILEGYDLGQYGNRSAEMIHLVSEAFRRAFFDRAEFLGDPDFAALPVAQLIDKRYGAAWRENLDPDHASPSAGLKRPAIFTELNATAAAVPCPRERCGIAAEPEHTTHYSVVDAEGTAVAVTTTLNDSFGSRVTAAGLGFLLNDEMDDFTTKPGVANLYGLIQGPANEIGPGKRPLSAMTPTIVLRPPRPSSLEQGPQLYMVLGSPGGPRIITTVANILLGVVDFGLNLQEAVNAPRFHHQWLPDTLRLEREFSPDTLRLLQNMGHEIVQKDYWGDGECILIDPQTGERQGASDGRNNGKALGY
jgi:gamma-glutamyltranspeptidase/glutathione hydrolase